MIQKPLVLVALILAGCSGAPAAAGPQAAFTPRVTYYASASANTPEPTFVVRFVATATSLPVLATPKSQPTPVRTQSPAEAGGLGSSTGTSGITQTADHAADIQTYMSGDTDIRPAILRIFGPPDSTHEWPATVQGIELIVSYMEYSPENITVMIAHKISDNPPFKWKLVAYVRTDSGTKVEYAAVLKEMAARLMRQNPLFK